MNFSPVPFKGVVKVTTKDSKESKPQTKYYITNKQQDGLLLKAAVSNLEHIGYKEDVYGSDTYTFHKTLEDVIQTTVPQPGKGFCKFFTIGGDVHDMFHAKKYDATYNKIFYRDASNSKYPISNVVVDLMSPEERLEAATSVLSKINNKLADITGIKNDIRISPQSLKSTLLPQEQYADIEEVLSKTLFLLDGNIGGADFLEYTPDFKDSSEAYEKLVDNIQRLSGTKYSQLFPSFIKYDDSNVKVSQKDMNALRRAVYYLDTQIESKKQV